MWWDHDGNWAGWLAMSVGMVGVWVLVALLGLVVVRSGRGQGAGPSEPEPRQILERRLARGEIDVEEYRARLEAMGQAGA
ncbi:putative membrane protein [Nocardioides ginsengisegetis]|uniref:Putative membrane protein n=1 Tax=Nocardioides ginsengisegetis TaxID=661491 RepID=A0A7W3P8S0_9ACTN|nr:SHOCT domain-containing protein [Nocardioides ginsengisegetis]MBA8802905.1 putative membrane protein [Nocardioides ginsengisegetis]